MTIPATFDVEAYCANLAKAGTEHAEQRAFFGWLGMHLHAGGSPLVRLAYAIPNGGKRDAITAARLKSEGVKAGVPDICYPVPRGRYAGLYIEMKIKSGSVQEAQKQWHTDLRAVGYASAVCWGWQHARTCFLDYEAEQPVAPDYR